MSAVHVRPERHDDYEAVRAINEEAFGSPVEANLVAALRATPGSVSLVATVDDEIAGHILFTPVTIDPPGSVRVAGLAPMAVRLARQRSGVGSALVRAGLSACRTIGYSAVVVVGHPEYYPRFGFVPAEDVGLRCEFEVPREAFMIVSLETSAIAAVRGVARYLPEFAAQ